jgi:AraC family transcriptional regulator
MVADGALIDTWHVDHLVFTRSRYSASAPALFHADRAATLKIVTAGALTETIAGRRYELAAGVAMFTPAGLLHGEQHSEDTECLVAEIPEHLALPAVIADRTARAWALNLSRALLTREPGWPGIAGDLVLEGLRHLERIHWVSPLRPPWLDQAVGLAREYYPLRTVAAHLGRHPSHVAREFHRHEGVSVGEYARRRRLELASMRLRTTEESIVDVALAAGFCDQSHFTNAFRRVFRITPAQFRRTVRSHAVQNEALGPYRETTG